MSDIKPRLLFVEDDVGKRYVIARQLRAAGFEIDEAETGEQGLALVSPLHDVAILDMRLPDMHGWDVCKRIKANPLTASVKVLELSATLATAEDRARGLELGADCYLVHPVELVELIAALRALIRLRKAERDRERAQELFLASLGHDLRNPLNLIITSVSILSESKTISEQELGIVKRMDRTLQRMTRMVDQLMMFTQTMGDERVPVTPVKLDLVALCEQVVRDTRQSTRRAIELRVFLDSSIPGDADKLTQLIDNLVANAIRHGDGTVTVQVARSGTWATLSVHNRGPVIDPGLFPTLFDPFTRAGGRDGGVGLGLYIVDQIAKAHGGDVTVVSNEAEGTTFTVRLPL